MEVEKLKLTTTQASKVCGCSRATINNHIKNGLLPATKRLNKQMIALSDLRGWAASQGLTLDLTKL